MNSFGRALKLSFSHRWNVAGCIISSLIIAVLWGGNLTAVFPVVDVIMNDSSLPQWIDQKIAESDQEVTDKEHWLARLNELKSDDPQQARQQIENEIVSCEAELAALKERAAGVWSDIQIAEKTRLTNFIDQLKDFKNAPANQIVGMVAAQKRQVTQRINAYESRAARLRWVAPAAHRWLPTTPFTTLVLVCAFVLVGTLLKSGFRIWNQVLVNRLGNIVGYDLRVEYYRKVLRLDMTNFSESGRGDLMNRCTSDLQNLSLGVQKVYGQALAEPLKVIVCVAIAAYISWQLLLLTVTIAPIAGYAIHWLGRALKRTHKKAMQELSTIYETLGETLSGIKLIQAYTMEPAERKKFDGSAQELYRRQMRIATYNSLVSPVTETLGITMVLIASLLGGYLVLGQHTHVLGIKISDIALTHGDMSVFFAMLVGMADPGRRLSQEFGQFQQSIAAADRVYEIIDRQPSIVDPPQPKTLPRLTKSLRFENINFRYHAEKQILNGIDLEVRAGETIAIVGPNGCGKTTLVQLLPRFYDPEAGRITLDGVDIRDVRLLDLRSRIGLVTQETLLFNDTVANNIRYGNLEASQAAVEAAARKAHAHTFITERLSEGYDTIVGPGGGRLSGGQRQRIVLARAILRNPEILILDEATSQIDVESEQLIQKVLDEFTRDRTTILITHRVSSIALADRVVVMDKGRIVDMGTPDELSRCELYRRLCHSGYRESA